MNLKKKILADSITNKIYRQYNEVWNILKKRSSLNNVQTTSYLNNKLLIKICSYKNIDYKTRFNDLFFIKELDDYYVDDVTQDLVDDKIKKIDILDNSEIFNHVIGQVFEKFVNKKELGAYYTSIETTNYIVYCSVLPCLINKWASYDPSLALFLSDFREKDNISFIEKQIKSGKIFNAFTKLTKAFDINKLKRAIKEITIIDISCGSGAFIFSAYYLLKKICDICNIDSSFELFNNIFGVDIDEEALCIFRFRLLFKSILEDDFSMIQYLNNFIIENSLEYKDIVVRQSVESEKINNILINGGFDVVIGNPPYIEVPKIKDTFKIDIFDTLKCNNTYALFLEKNLKILKDGGQMGMIVPISYISTQRMQPIRYLLSNNSEYHFCSSYADRPSCLFKGVHQKLNILLLQKKNNSKTRLYTSSYIHWYNDENGKVFEKKLNYQLNIFRNKNFFPKLGNEIEERIFKKVTYNNKSLLDNTTKSSNHNVYLSMRLCFWNKSSRKEKISNEYKAFYFKNNIDTLLFSAIINSNLFFFFWEIVSDGWHITMKELRNFKIDFEKIKNKEEIVEKYLSLEKDLETKKVYVNTKQIDYEYQHKKSKTIIDEIDKLLGKSFNLTDEEIKYLVDYQVRYRMNDEYENYLKVRENECN